MTVRVLFFSLLRDIVGGDELEFTIEENDEATTTVADLLNAVYEKFPALREWESKLLIAVDCEYSDRDTEIREGQEIALMPPVQGG